MPETLLVVEDDASILRGLQMNLQIEGYRVLSARDGLEGLRLWRDCRPDLIVLDLMLPRCDGHEVLREIRATDPDTRILILSARGQEADKVLGLTLGADDYLSKPFSLPELLARIRAALRRVRLATPAGRIHRFGKVLVDVDARQVTVDGASVEMTAREFDLLVCFISQPNRVMSREDLMATVWGPSHHGTLRTIDNFVARLRLKLEEDPDQPRFLETVRGIGYRFMLGEPAVRE
jgi:DNA-binding response OmpR family regulator